MAKLPIIIAPDPILKVTCDPVEDVNQNLVKLMDDMLETMYEAPGIGLAAPQVGVTKRLLVVDVARGEEPPAPLCLVNPEILRASDQGSVYDEGCLSLPEHYAEVERPAEIKIGYIDRDGKRQELEANGLLATCIQHEMDHLDGVLFVDHLSSLKRGMILRKLKKLKKSEQREHIL